MHTQARAYMQVHTQKHTDTHAYTHTSAPPSRPPTCIANEAFKCPPLLVLLLCKGDALCRLVRLVKLSEGDCRPSLSFLLDGLDARCTRDGAGSSQGESVLDTECCC